MKCPNCDSFMFHKSDGLLHCSKCEENEISSVNNTIKMCPNCGSSMMLQTNGDFICSKCDSIYFTNAIPANKDTTNHNDYYVNYDEIYKNNHKMQGNFPPNEIKEIQIIADKITITERSIGITIDLSDKNCFDKVDSIVINGIRFNREFKDENT